MKIKTPYYLIYEKKLLSNLKIIKYIREVSGAKSVLALKCFSTWCVFDLIKQYMDGTTSSSFYEARLGREKFGKEVHAYSVAYNDKEIQQVSRFATKIIFNSISQLRKYHKVTKRIKLGLRVNPKISYSHFDLADPARKYSRLGVLNKREIVKVTPLISGLMFHFNCENDDFNILSRSLDTIGRNYGDLLKKMEWVSLGGGLYFTKEGYPVEKFCKKLKEFSDKFSIQIYLEPGESVITQSAELVTSVLDVTHNDIDIAIVDASTEAHMLDLLIYQTPAKIDGTVFGTPKNGTSHKYIVAGRSCLAGDVFGTYNFKNSLKIGSEIRISDAAGYSMVKKNWFNGLSMPSIAVKRLNGKIDLVRNFTYNDFKNSLS
ncbi:MAG: carboxynorspermidine decarboxylase [Elusimicrobia bacterium RIFOXYA2_FULL_40_6]|nr:MAG: carboxynorspermidine decarboxylase [Elusimicrobia bacterium RIFOXYA2_FULL_40_6]